MKTGLSSGLADPRAVGYACALTATCLGIFYLVAAGAPARYAIVNAVAFPVGVAALAGVQGAMELIRRHSGALLLGLGAGLLATALLGAAADGAARWIWIGPISVQVSLVVLPAMIVGFARSTTPLGALGMAVAAVAMALQPDRAMAGVLALGLAILATARPGRSSVFALVTALAAFAVALARPDTLAAVPFVDQILFTAFDVHPLAGAAVLTGALLLLVPAMAGVRRDPASRPVLWVFAAVWAGCIAAAVLGNYPTPVVGYGGSFILGYLFSVSCLPAPVRSVRGAEAGAAPEDEGPPAGLRRSASPA